MVSVPGESLMMAALLASLVGIAVETDRAAMQLEPLPGLVIAQWVTLGFYTAEILCNIFIFQGHFFRCAWNVIDLVILLADSATLILDHLSDEMPMSLRMLRICRVARSVKVLSIFPTVRKMVEGMLETLKIVACGMLLLGGSMLVIGVLSVQVLHPINQRLASRGVYAGCERCPRAFESTASSVLTYSQQIVAGDSWGSVAIPIIEEEPASALFFGLVFAIIGMIIMNLILALVVESAMKATAVDTGRLLKEKEAAYSRHVEQVVSICREMDVDQSGFIDASEFARGFAESGCFREIMNLANFSVEDIDEVFDLLDTAGGGKIAYDELVHQLHKMQSSDQHATLFVVKQCVVQLKEMMAKLVKQEAGTVELARLGATLLARAASDTPQAGEMAPRTPDKATWIIQESSFSVNALPSVDIVSLASTDSPPPCFKAPVDVAPHQGEQPGTAQDLRRKIRSRLQADFQSLTEELVFALDRQADAIRQLTAVSRHHPGDAGPVDFLVPVAVWPAVADFAPCDNAPQPSKAAPCPGAGHQAAGFVQHTPRPC